MNHDPDDLDPQIRMALAEALRERKVRLNDRRLLIIFLFVVALLVATGFVVQRLATVVDQSNADRHHFERLITASCRDTRTNARTINIFLDKQYAAYASSPVLSPSERLARAAIFSGLKQKIPSCPPKER